MPESPPPGESGNASGTAQEGLTAEVIEGLLADFRIWLEQAASAPAAAAPDQEPSEPIDLHTLLAQFIALRHEVNLQTRATRAQQEQNVETLDQLRAAFAALEQQQTARRADERRAQDEVLRPFLKTLVDVYDAVALAGREVQRVREAVLPSLGQVPAALEAVTATLAEAEDRRASSPSSPWRRWFGGGREERNAGSEWRTVLEEEKTRARQESERIGQLLGSLLMGYTMSVQRIERALEQSGFEPISTVGEPFDPERMEAVAAVPDSGRPAGQVLEEVRRGYLWRGRVFRYAQVSVAR